MNINPIDLSKKSIWTQLYTKSKDQYWLPNSVSLTEDKSQWAALEPSLKEQVLSLLKYAIMLDSHQVTNISSFCAKVQEPDLKALLAYHSMMEAIHSESYAYFAQSVCTPEEKQYLFELDAMAIERMDIITEIADEYGQVAANYWLEAVAFQSLFRLADILRSKNLLPGLSSLIQFISRDEELHVKTFALMMTPEDKLFTKEALERFALREGKLLAITTGISSFVQYLQFITQYRIKSLGWQVDLPENPFKDIYALGDGSKRKLKGNFFTSALVYDTDRADLNWDVNSWFQPPAVSTSKVCPAV